MTIKPDESGITAEAHDSGPLEQRLLGTYESLPPSERRVADLLLNFPGHLATHSATEIAALSGSSKAAVSRLIQRLGYETFSMAREAVRSARQWGAPTYQESASGTAPINAADALAAHVNGDIAILRHTLDSIDASRLDALVDTLATARRILVIGHRNSALLANFLRGHLGLLRDGIDLAPMQGATLAEGLVGLDASDVLIAVGFRRRVPAFTAALEVAKRRGVPTAVITDPTGAALAGAAQWVLTAHCRGASMFDSYVSAVSLITYLAERLARRLGAGARQRLHEIEALHGALDDLI